MKKKSNSQCMGDIKRGICWAYHYSNSPPQTIQYNIINIHITMDVKTSAQLLQRHLIHHDKAKAQVKLIGRIL